MATAAFLAIVSEQVPPGMLQLLFWPVGLFVFVLSTELARLSDHKFVTGEDLVNALHRAAELSVQVLKERRFFLLFMVGIHFFNLHLAQQKASAALEEYSAAHVAPDPSDLFAWLFSSDSKLAIAGLVMFCGPLLQGGSTYRLPGVGGCLRQMFQGVPLEVVNAQLRKASDLNFGPDLALHGYWIVVFATSLVCPVLCWVLGVFGPLLTYVAFREMFLDGDGNRKRAPRTVSSRASQSATGAA